MSQSSTLQDGSGNHNGLTQTNYSSAIPDHWTELFPPQRNNAMPQVFKTQHHSLVNGPRGDIFVVYMDTEKAAMEKLQAYGAVQHPPDDLTSWLSLDPCLHNYLLCRPKNGSGLEADDLIISWSMPCEDLSSSQIARLQKLQSDLIGPVDLNGPFKPVRQSNGQFIGGTAFERSVRDQPIGGKDARCYPVATSNQVQRWLEAPSIGNKSSLGDTENTDLRSRLLKETIDIPLEGLRRVRPDVLQTTAVQADYTNAIRVGSHDNTVWTTCQVNFNGSDENIDELPNNLYYAKLFELLDDNEEKAERVGVEREKGDEEEDDEGLDGEGEQRQEEEGQEKEVRDGQEEEDQDESDDDVIQPPSSRKRKYSHLVHEDDDDGDIMSGAVDTSSTPARDARVLRSPGHRRLSARHSGDAVRDTTPDLAIGNTHHEDGHDYRRRKANDGSIIGLGKFGENHADCTDSPVSPTAMLCMTKPHPDVELELFFLYELGFYWIQREFAVIFFSGLFYHSGREVIWKSPRQDPRVYNRITVIFYPSSPELNGIYAVAFAANGNGGIETISVEERNTSTHSYEERNTTTQANYTSDGLRLMDEHSYFLWFTRSCISKCSGFVNQTPPDLRIRIDEELFLSSFSMVHEGTRIQAPSWPMGPGWKGDDVRIGKRYDDLQLLDIEDPDEREREKIRKWNSDEGSGYPYGKKERLDQSMKWKELTKVSGQCYPLYTSAGPKATKHGMMSATKRARKAVVNATGVPSPVKRKKRSNNEHSLDTHSLSPAQHDCILIRLLAPEEINLLLQGLREAFPTSSSASTILSSSSQFAASTSSLTAITISAHTGLSIGGPLLFELTQTVNNNELAGMIDKEDHLLLNMHLWEWLDQCRGSVEELRLGHYPDSWLSCAGCKSLSSFPLSHSWFGYP
ncbi:hypothetical protein K435DRAFT_878731 [Dendrothele bispora CBS 962.96]|uniref:Uncharacterized protein n=1 Tax=Dendrothele bispora (strain CBS 962.96) TaxID=1314807 RepID=A0A4S8KMQ6_DENBC|nr:hypothetical protein K435DRAFT_878731 [Dendrothele bispora CBS 962.96]